MEYEYEFLTPVVNVLSTSLGRASVFVFVLFLWKELTMGICAAKTRLDGKLAVVTGGSSGIGFETAKGLAARGSRVIIGCRNKAKGMEAVKKIIDSTGNKEVYMMDLDLADLRTVRKFAEDINNKEKKLDILVNNAGIGSAPPPSVKTTKSGKPMKGVKALAVSLTTDKNEVIVQTNHLGHFLLTNLLKKALTAAGNARVINVSSMMQKFGYVDFDNINSEKKHSASRCYFDTKLMVIMFTKELAKRWNGSGISTFSLHPGMVRTQLALFPKWIRVAMIPLGYLLGKSPKQGAQTTLHCCLEPGLEECSGTFWYDCRMADDKALNPQAKDEDVTAKLWEKSALLVKYN